MLKASRRHGVQEIRPGDFAYVVSESGGMEKGAEDFECASADGNCWLDALGWFRAGGSIAAPDAGGFAMPLVFGLTLRSGFVQLGSDSVCPRFENR